MNKRSSSDVRVMYVTTNAKRSGCGINNGMDSSQGAGSR